MLDENLPTFYLRSSGDGVKHNASVLLSQYGSEAAPTYYLRHPDPALPASRNRYAVALYDSYVHDILYGEVLLSPEWSQPNATKEETRQNGSIPPPPQPIQPTEFVVQLYNPDQQVHVNWHAGTWSSAPYWFFEIPQQTFRQPSSSSLDRTQSDPTFSEATPKLGFKWKKDGKLSKDFVCTLSDKSTNPDGTKRKNKEPDIIVAIFKNYKEITIYEPNLARVDVEDPKGLEVVLILGAIVLREVFSTTLREAFNIVDAASVPSPPSLAPQTPPRRHRHSFTGLAPSNNAVIPPHDSASSQVPPTDPRTQWELDAEAARLRKEVEQEERDRRRADAAEAKRVKKMLEDEDRRAKERQKEIDRETERLKRIYGKEEKASLQQLKNRQPAPPLPTRHSDQSYLSPHGHPVTAYPPAPLTRPHSAAPAPYIASNLLAPHNPYQDHFPDPHAAPAPYLASNLRAPHNPYQDHFPDPHGAPGHSPNPVLGNFASASSSNPAIVPKKSFWKLGGGGGGGSSGDSNRLSKQRSTVF